MPGRGCRALSVPRRSPIGAVAWETRTLKLRRPSWCARHTAMAFAGALSSVPAAKKTTSRSACATAMSSASIGDEAAWAAVGWEGGRVGFAHDAGGAEDVVQRDEHQIGCGRQAPRHSRAARPASDRSGTRRRGTSTVGATSSVSWRVTSARSGPARHLHHGPGAGGRGTDPGCQTP